MEIAKHLQEVDDSGYTVLRQPFGSEMIDEVEEAVSRVEGEVGTKLGRNPFHGHKTVRLKGLVNRGEAFEKLMIQPAMLALVEGLLGPDVQLGSTQAIIIGPGETAQPLHPDRVHPALAMLEDSSHPPVRTGLDVMLALSDFTQENGATRIAPGSHRIGTLDESDAVDTVSLEAERGDLLIWDANLWHGGGANRTNARRTGLLTFWVPGWVRPDDNLLLLIPREKVARFPRRLQELVGFRAFGDFAGRVAGYDPMSLLDPEGRYTEASQEGDPYPLDMVP